MTYEATVINPDIVSAADTSEGRVNEVLQRLQERLKGILLEIAQLSVKRDTHVPLNGKNLKLYDAYFALRLVFLLDKAAREIILPRRLLNKISLDLQSRRL